MSRIDEAMRRAAEEQAANDSKGQETSAPLPLAAGDVRALAREPFPIEINAARGHHPHTATSDLAAEAAAALPKSNTREESLPRKPLLERIDARLAEKVVADVNMSAIAREQYRRLAAMLHDAQGNTGVKVVMIASALPGEGKTLTAANLGLTLSESYRRRVLLVDADLRKPALHQVFRLNTTTGLIDGLESKSGVKLVVRQVTSELWVLPAGRPTPDPMAGLTSERMRLVLEEAKEAFDWVLIDTPPLMTLTDAHLLSSLVDTAVLVVKANSTPHDMVQRTADIIGRNRVVGVVLNQAENGGPGTYNGYYGGSYGESYYLPAPNDGQRT